MVYLISGKIIHAGYICCYVMPMSCQVTLFLRLVNDLNNSFINFILINFGLDMYDAKLFGSRLVHISDQNCF